MYGASKRGGRSSPLSRIRLLFLILLGLAALAMGAEPDASQRERLAQIRVPFVENCGQWDERVAFGAKAGCPGDPVTRGAMAKLLANAFQLQLYGP